MNQNNISTNIFGHENKRLHPIYLSKEKFENCTALLLIGNEDKSQYVYIKDFLTDLRILKQNIKAKSIFVWAVYNALVLNKVVNFSIKVCLEIYVKEATKMPEKDSNAFFFSIWVFFHEHSRFTGLQGKRGVSISALPLPPASQTLRH